MDEVLVPKSKFVFYIEACGPYLLPMLLSAVIVFALTILLLVFSRRTAAWAALVLMVPMPLLIGVFGALSNSINTWSVVTEADMPLKASDYATMYAEVVIPVWIGMLLSALTYLVAVIGLVIRSFGKDERGSS